VNNWVLLPEARRQYGPGVTAGDVLGYLPDILNSGDHRPVATQLDERYAHGGGFRPFGRGEWEFTATTGRLKYPGDPAMMPLASIWMPLSGELLFFYPQQMLLIVGAGGLFTVTRVD
jgi:hypothetical protein